jgi:hypothetical protein
MIGASQILAMTPPPGFSVMLCESVESISVRRYVGSEASDVPDHERSIINGISRFPYGRNFARSASIAEKSYPPLVGSKVDQLYLCWTPSTFAIDAIPYVPVITEDEIAL